MRRVRTQLAGEFDRDAAAGRDHASWGRHLLASYTAANDIQFEAGFFGSFKGSAHWHAYQGGHADTFTHFEHHGSTGVATTCIGHAGKRRGTGASQFSARLQNVLGVLGILANARLLRLKRSKV